MKELTFEIIHIHSERRINGKTNIRAVCLQDDTCLDIEIPNSELNNKSSVKTKFNYWAYEIIRSRERTKRLYSKRKYNLVENTVKC